MKVHINGGNAVECTGWKMNKKQLKIDLPCSWLPSAPLVSSDSTSPKRNKTKQNRHILNTETTENAFLQRRKKQVWREHGQRPGWNLHDAKMQIVT